MPPSVGALTRVGLAISPVRSPSSSCRDTGPPCESAVWALTFQTLQGSARFWHEPDNLTPVTAELFEGIP